MGELIQADFQGVRLNFTDDGWFNATVAAARFGMPVREWLRLPSTRSYIAALERRCGKIPHVKTSRGRVDRGGGTWLHPKLAVVFARWLDDDFAVWCDAQIDGLLQTGQRQARTAWQELQRLNLEDADSRVRASFGSRLMLERKAKLPGLRSRLAALERAFAPQLPFKASA